MNYCFIPTDVITLRIIHVVNSEYKTPTQNINKGSFTGQYTITPSAGANGATITDASIQTELSAQIAAGRLPAPQVDSQSNPVTYYAIYFPPGKKISAFGSTSCASGGFCAYHGTVAASASRNEYYYAVHPDMQAGSGCASGCGTGNVFQNYCAVSSHELIEMMTGVLAFIIYVLALLDL